MQGKRQITKKKKEELSYVLDEIHNHNINLNTREIYMHGVKSESEEPGVDFRMATAFIKNVHLLNNEAVGNILVHMQSIGGCWDNGMAIFNVIEYSPSPITILAYSQASSMTGIILQSAKKRVFMPDCYLMLHYGYADVGGTANAVISSIDFMEKANKRMLDIFAVKAVNGPYFRNKNKSLSYVKNWIDKKMKDKGDWYLDAQAAIDFGFADGILGERGFKDIAAIRK